jgi:hypothetical protein
MYIGLTNYISEHRTQVMDTSSWGVIPAHFISMRVNLLVKLLHAIWRGENVTQGGVHIVIHTLLIFMANVMICNVKYAPSDRRNVGQYRLT